MGIDAQDKRIIAVTRVRRISDSKEFVLGLSELKAIDEKSNSYQLLEDFSVWLVNNR